jgi:hypothetical protein
VAPQERLGLVEPARLQQQGDLDQVDPAGIDPALDRDKVRAAGVSQGGQGRLQVALDDGDLAAVQGPAGGLGPAAGPLARLPHPLEDPAAALRRPDVDLLDEQVVQGPVEDVAEVAGLGLGHRPLEQGDALVVAVDPVGQGGALVDQGGGPDRGQPTASAMASALSAHRTASACCSFSMWASAARL